ncbi:MAG: superoxide dismutase [Anaerovorax sp.]
MYQHYKFENPPLPYDYDALEPYIDTKTMQVHHDKHLQTYIDNLNKIVEEYPALQSLSLTKLILHGNRLPLAIRTAVKNNGGGVFNHEFYFEGMANMPVKVPVGQLAEAINKRYGSFEEFQKMFKNIGMSVFGSGYTWLVMDRSRRLRIVGTADQDTPLTHNQCPILALDVWEHAYYLKHLNKRGDYIDHWFQVVNWERADENYLHCKEIF